MSHIAAIRTNPRPAAWDQLPTTLPQALTAANPATPLIYVDHQGREHESSYGELLAQAQRIASAWRAQTVAPGNKVILQLTHNQHILPAFWGCLLAGLEPVIVPVPVSYDFESRQRDQLQHLYDLFESPLILTNAEYASAILRSPGLSLLHDARFFDLDTLLQQENDGLHHLADPQDVAFYTLSSGSTGLSKAVTLTHRNMISRGLGANQLCNNQQTDVIFSWLPFDHIGNISAYHISPILTSSKLVYAPKEYVLGKPTRWLDLMDRHRVTHTWAPNFAFGLISKSLQKQRGTWDLSCLKGMLSAGELISHTTVIEFLAATQEYGLAPESVISAFGMAEVCSGVNYHLPAHNMAIRFAHLDRRQLDGKIHPTSASDPHSISFASLGPVVPGMAMRIVDANNHVLNEGEIGRFQLHGDALMQGYYRNPEANTAFTEDGWFDTGDAAFILDAELYLVGRADLGIIVNGVNLSNAEVEAAIEEVVGVEPAYTAACTVFPPNSEELKLAVFYHPAANLDAESLANLPRRIQAHMTEHLGIRADFLIAVSKEEVPKTEIGKIQHKKLIQHFQAGKFAKHIEQQSRQSSTAASQLKLDGAASLIHEIWSDALSASQIGLDDNFFELGGDSLALMQVLDRINNATGASLTLVDLFKYTTIESLAEAIEGTKKVSASHQAQHRAERRRQLSSTDTAQSRDIAIIGMACRFPGADDLDEFWTNLIEGVESITRFSDAELEQGGFSRGVFDRPEYVKASPLLKDARRFDAEFFGYSRYDAEWMDPQHRQFLECAWETFENAGYDPTSYPGTVGIYGGAAMNTYLFNNVWPNRQALDPNDDLSVATLDSMGGFMAMVGNDKDYLTTRVSYKLNLSGPSVNVQTACSTGLVSIHMACQALLAGEADMFLAGCASIQSPEHAGHLYQPGMITTPDGHVRSFDAKAGGTIFGSGVGAVLLKRLDDALKDGDHIHAVVKGTAVSNDGGGKVGYMAPCSDGQALAVGEALAVANVPADSIGMVEAHGTGTVVGDPIEFDGLCQVFRNSTDKKGFCALGSVKTNVGHLQITSGTAGFIKTALSVSHGKIPPLVNFESPNPALAIEDSPFFINTETIDWPLAGPRRAAINSLGIGGTNAHVILEQAPALPERDLGNDRPAHLLLLSARNPDALRKLAMRYRDHLHAHPEQPLADICFTANVGRKTFSHKLAVHADSSATLIAKLENWLEQNKDHAKQATQPSKTTLAFLFTGQGTQYAGMGAELYASQPEFKRHIDACHALFSAEHNIDLIQLLTSNELDDAALLPTRLAQPAIFSMDYALARLWQSWGVEPDYLLGHSLGEYVAACISGVFSLEDAVRLVSTRAELMQGLPEDGEMWAIHCDAKTARSVIHTHGPSITLAADNAPESIVISGDATEMKAVIQALEAQHIQTQRLPTSHAFHSPRMEPITARFEELAKKIHFNAPNIPLVSNLTGSLASEEITSADYWTQHMLRTVRFRQSIETLDTAGVNLFLEIGPKPTLRNLGAQCLPEANGWLHTLQPQHAAWDTLLTSAAELAQHDRLDLHKFDAGYPRRRVPLPTYPFAATRYWLEPPEQPIHQGGVESQHLLGEQIALPTLNAVVFENHFDPIRLPILRDHLIGDSVVASAAVFVNMMLEAARHQHQNKSGVEICEITFERPLILGEKEQRTVQTSVTENGTHIEVFSMTARTQNTAIHHASSSIASAPNTIESVSLDEARRNCNETRSVSAYLAQLKERNFTLGASYRWMSSLRLGNQQALAELKQPTRLGGLALDAGPHPGLLDTCFGLLLATAEIQQGSTWLPFGIDRIHWTGRTPNAARFARFVLRPESNEEIVIGDGQILDENGQVLIAIEGLQARPMQSLDKKPEAQQIQLYQSAWHTFEPAKNAETSTHWLLLGKSAFAQELATALRANGHHVTLSTNATEFTIDEVDGVISLLALSPDGDEFSALYQNLQALQTLTTAEHFLQRGVWIVSDQGALVADNDIPKPEQTSLRGFYLSARHEHPELNVRQLDIAGDISATRLAQLVNAASEAPVFALRGDQIWQLRIRPSNIATQTSMPAFRSDRTYLITGAHGALGQAITDWLVRNGVRHLLLVARSQPNKERTQALEKLSDTGVSVTTVQCDLESLDAVKELFKRSECTEWPVAGIFHCAGVLKDRLLTEATPEDLHQVLAGKALGAKHLDLAANTVEPLDYFVLFSSAAAMLGNGGQTAYAAANAYLDGLAQQRHSKGQAACAINWGPWAEDGMATHSVASRQLAAQGFRPIEPQAALQAMANILSAQTAQVMVLDCNWDQYATAAPANIGLLDGALLSRKQPQQSTTHNTATMLDFSAMNADEQRAALYRLVKNALAETLAIPDPTSIPEQTLMIELGLDSLQSIQLRNRMSKMLGKSLPVGLTFSYPTVDALVDFLITKTSDPAATEFGSASAVGNQAQSILDDLDQLLNDTPS